MGKTVLIVDDSRTIRQQVTFTLKKGGFEVIEASDGVEGLDRLKEHGPNIGMVISDVNMPNMDGIEMVETIGADATLKGHNFPIIMLTTEGSSELVNRAKKAGAKGWLVKPFEPDVLISAAKKFLE